MDRVNDTERDIKQQMNPAQLAADLEELARTLWDGAATASALADSLQLQMARRES